jgi:hypothetical protein
MVYKQIFIRPLHDWYLPVLPKTLAALLGQVNMLLASRTQRFDLVLDSSFGEERLYYHVNFIGIVSEKLEYTLTKSTL